MNHAELFVLHPIAYVQGQEILQREADMVRHGLSPTQRIASLQTELARISQLTDVSMAEALGSILPATYGELLGDINEMRARLLRHGCSGTLRSFRNLHRRYGIDFAVLDPLLVQGALGVLENDAHGIPRAGTAVTVQDGGRCEPSVDATVPKNSFRTKQQGRNYPRRAIAV